MNNYQLKAEKAFILNLITNVYPSGVVSIVCDSYDFWRNIDVNIRGLRDIIMAREGKVVVRPDSGNPVDIICGDNLAKSGSSECKGALQLLWEIFGGTVNAAGYKVLDPHIGLIYGDAITVDRASLILQLMQEAGFASSNIVFGVGSYTYQYVTRDTFGFAMKATSCVVNGERRAIFKDPVTASESQTKKSARGLLRVDYLKDDGELHVEEDVCEVVERKGHLETVYENGAFNYKDSTNLADIRYNLSMELDSMV